MLEYVLAFNFHGAHNPPCIAIRSSTGLSKQGKEIPSRAPGTLKSPVATVLVHTVLVHTDVERKDNAPASAVALPCSPMRTARLYLCAPAPAHSACAAGPPWFDFAWPASL